jgi:hypothetical protein
MIRPGIVILLVLAGAASLVGAPEPGHLGEPPTSAQLGLKCSSAFTGARNTAEFRAYSAKCLTAVTNATSNATDAGNPANADANRKRATAACAAQFRPPRNTAAKQKAFASCVKAAIASQLKFGGRPKQATLRGSNEVPAAGAATGTASIRVNEGRRRVCFTLVVSGLDGSPVVGAHIHRGGIGVNGIVVVALTPIAALDGGKPATGCVNGVPAATIRSIRRKPGDFYVNVHTQKFPNGAARGQLRHAPSGVLGG